MHLLKDVAETNETTNQLNREDGLGSGRSMEARAALQHFRQLYRQAQRKANQDGMGWALLNIAIILRRAKQDDNSLKILEDARTLFVMTKNHLGLAATFEELSTVNRELNRCLLALDYATKAIEIFAKLNKPLDLAWAYNNVALIYLNLFQREESLAYAKKAQALFEEHNSQNGLAWNACVLGNLFLTQGQYPSAASSYSQALDIFSSFKNQMGTAWSLLGLGTVLRSQGKYETALDNFSKAKKIFLDLNFQNRVGWCELNQAAILRALGDYEGAFSTNKRCLQIFGPLKNNEGVAWLFFQLGQIYRERGQLVKAWQVLRDSINLHSDISNQAGVGWAENEWGRTYYELNDQSHAFECFIKAREASLHIGSLPLQLEADKNMAQIYLDDGLIRKAEEQLSKLELQSSPTLPREIEVEQHLARTRSALMIGDVKKAKEHLEQSAAIAEAHHIKRLKPQLNIYKGEICMIQGKQSEALHFWTEAKDLAQQLGQHLWLATALLGLLQIDYRESSSLQKSFLLRALAKEVRSIGSRKLKAKFLVIKGLLKNGLDDNRYFRQALDVLHGNGLVVLDIQLLELIRYVHQRSGQKEEAGQIQKIIQELLNQGSVDLSLVWARREMFEILPVSLVI